MVRLIMYNVEGIDVCICIFTQLILWGMMVTMTVCTGPVDGGVFTL